jgi:RNA polymerase sigma factor (sigma-70 family)
MPTPGIRRPFDDVAGQSIGLRLARREELALEEAYAAYAPMVLAYARRHVGRDDAEDVLQRTFLEAWRHAGRYDPRKRFSGWLFTIAYRRAVDVLRQRRHQVIDPDLLSGVPGQDGRELVDRLADAAAVRAAVERLPEHERVVVILTYFEELSQREVADRLGVPIGTVKARASRGVRRLREMMRAGDETPAELTAHQRLAS